MKYKFETLEKRELLCGTDGMPIANVVEDIPNIEAIQSLVSVELEVQVDRNTAIAKQGMRRFVVYREIGGNDFKLTSLDPRIVGTILLNEDGGVSTDQVITRSAGQRRLELAVGALTDVEPNSQPIGNAVAIKNVSTGKFAIGTGGGVFAKSTVFRSPEGWRPDPFSDQHPASQLDEVTGAPTICGGCADRMWAKYSPERRVIQLRPYFTIEEFEALG